MTMVKDNLKYNANEQQAMRDVTSTAKLFNFNRPVFISNLVWRDCVDIHNIGNELAVLQRLRHVLFMASSALRNRVTNVDCEFRIQRIPSDKPNARPESVTLKLKAFVDENDQPVATITFPEDL